MNTLEFLRRLKAARKDIYKIGGDIAVEDSEILVDMNKQQMLDGLGNDDKYLPTYASDPYFKTPQQAQGYENWKAKISTSRTKPKGVMDGYINGKFHSSIEFRLMARQRLHFYSNTQVGKELDRWTEGRIYGLNNESIEQYRVRFMPELVKRIDEYLRG